MTDIFISYSNSDRSSAQELAGRLQELGLSVWWDRDILPGKTFDHVIEQQLAAARCVIVLWTNSSVISNWVRAEATEAAKRNILVPVLIEEVVIPLEFRRIQAAKLTSWDGPEFDSFLRAVYGVLKQPLKPKALKHWAPKVATPQNVASGTTVSNKAIVSLMLLVLGTLALGEGPGFPFPERLSPMNAVIMLLLSCVAVGLGLSALADVNSRRAKGKILALLAIAVSSIEVLGLGVPVLLYLAR